MGKYDSILKEKKEYHNPVIKKGKYTKYIISIILITLLVILASYIIYFQTILSPYEVLKNDFLQLKNTYQTIYQNIVKKDVISLSYLKGEIILENNSYDYTIQKDNHHFSLNLSSEENNFNFELTPTSKSIGLSSFSNQKITKTINSSITKEKILALLKQKKSYRTIYISNHQPIVEVNYTFTSSEINKLLGENKIKDDYQWILTLKNNALTNEIISIKLIINNEGKNERSTIEYEKNKVCLTTPKNHKLEFVLVTEKNDFQLKIYKEGEIYSILIGREYEHKYEYTYQVIDKIYNIKLDIMKESTGYLYEISSKINKDKEEYVQDIKIKLSKGEKDLEEEIFKETINEKNISSSEKEKLKQELDKFLSPLLTFFKEYKDNIN